MTRLLMTTDAVGGVWQYSNELAAALAPLGVETVLAVMGPSRPSTSPFRRFAPPSLSRPEREEPAQLAKGEGDESAPVEVIPTNLPLDWLAPGAVAVTAAGDAIAALAREVKADVVHLNSPALAARTRFPVPVVAVAHGCVGTWWRSARGTEPDSAYAWHVELMAQGLRAADAIVAPSAAFAAALQHTYALSAPPLVVHNGRTPLVLPEAKPSGAVFTAGRLWDEAKNIALLDQVAALIDAPFRAAGPATGPQGERPAMRHLDHLGALDEPALAAELAATPVYVSAAKFEPFGLSVLEAAAAGCPLVLSGIDTFRELWTGAALFAGEETPQAYAAAIARIQADPSLRAHLGEAARVRAARYTPQAMAGAMAALYAGLLARPVRAAA